MRFTKILMVLIVVNILIIWNLQAIAMTPCILQFVTFQAAAVKALLII